MMNLFELQEAFVKTIIEDTIETYSGQWRIVHEAVQNSHDSIQRNKNIKRGKIAIRLFVGSNVVQVEDNGTGIAVEKFGNIFLLGGTDKNEKGLRMLLKGSQGVGIKSTLFTSEKFKIETVHDNQQWEYEIGDCHRFSEPGFNAQLKQPKPKPSQLPTGSTFTYSLHDYTVQDFLNEIVNDYCEETKSKEDQDKEVQDADELKVVLETYFRTKTYLGCVQAMLGGTKELKPIDVDVTIAFDFKSLEDHKALTIERCRFISEPSYYKKEIQVEFPGKYLDILELHEDLDRHEQSDRVYEDFEDVLNNPPDQTIRKLLVQKFDKNGVKRLLDRSRRDHTGKLMFESDQTRNVSSV